MEKRKQGNGGDVCVKKKNIKYYLDKDLNFYYIDEDGQILPVKSIDGSSTLVQPKTKSFNLATHWKMGFFYEFFCQI